MLFGNYLRGEREQLKKVDSRYSLRQTATRVGIEPAYLSKIERGDMKPPGEGTIRRLAEDLSLDSDVLLALGGKVSTDLLEVIKARPQLFANLLRELKEAPDHAVYRVVREVCDGEW